MEPDRDALLASNKALYVIFIIMISVINLVLIVKQARKPKFYLNVKAMIIFSLAIGDLLFALFPLVVMAQLVYASDLSSLTCRLLTSSGTYLNYLIHFVYGIGLVTLGTEVLLRHRIYNINIHKGIIALFASSIPWILGLVIILPLTLANVDFEYTCLNSQSPESMAGVSVFFPAALAVLVTAILNCVTFTQENNRFANSNQPQVVYQPQAQQPGVQQHNNPYTINEQPAKHVHVNGQGVNQYPSNQPGVYQYPSNQPGVYQYPSNQPGVYQYPSNQPGVYQYPSNQPGVYQYPINPPGVYPYTINQQQTVNIHIASNQTTNTAAISTAAISTSNRKTEIQRLLVIAILFFIMVVPVNGVALNTRTIVWPDTMTAVVVTQFLYWVMVFRSFLTPLIMLSISDL